MSQVDLRHIRARMQRSTSPDIPTSGPVYKPFHPYAKIAPDALTRAEKRRKIARRKAERHPDPLPTPPPSLPRASSHRKDASDTSAKPLLAIEDTAKEAHALPISPTKWFLSSPAGALAGFFNRVTRGVLGENVAPNKASTNASLRECHEGNNSEVTGRKRGREEGEKDSEDDDADGGDKTEDVRTSRPKYSRVRKRRKEVDFEREQLISLEAGSGYTADMDCDSDAMEEDGGYVQNSPRAESRKGFIPSADDRVDVEWERANDDGEDLRGVVSSAGGEDGKGVSNIGIRTTDDQATERFDFAAGDSNGIGFDDDKEKEEKGDGGSMDMRSDSNADSCRVVSKEGVGEDWEEAPPNVSIHITDDRVAEQSDFALGDSTGAALNEGEEMEEEDSSSDPRSDTDSNSDSSDSDDSSMSDDDMLGNTFQLTDVEISNVQEQTGGCCQVGDRMVVKGKNNAVSVCTEPPKSVPLGDVDDVMTVANFEPKHGRVEAAPSAKRKEKAPGPNPLAFSKPLECNFFTPSPLVRDRRLSQPSRGSTPGCHAGCGDTTSQHHQPKAMNDNSTRIRELRDLQDSIESNIRANIWQELGKIVESSVATALEKALPDLINQSADGGAGTSSPQMSKSTPKKIKKLPKPRTPSHNEFKKSVRELGKELLRLGDHEELPLPVGQREISAWDSKRGPCCTVEDFRIDLEGLPRSEWNKSAALVFAAEYLKRHQGRQGENLTLEYVSQAWLTHVIALRARYKDKQRDVLDRKERKARNRRRQRKHELYGRRLQTAYEYKEIKDRAVAIVESLGQDGMSSDESDHEGHRGEATYYILDKDWRSKQVTSWLRMLDSLHLRLRYNGNWQVTAGAWPHFRTAGLKESEGSPVEGLPIDFYCRNWYGAQNAFVKEQLQAKNQSDTLAIPSQYAKMAEKYNLSDRRVVYGRMFS